MIQSQVSVVSSCHITKKSTDFGKMFTGSHGMFVCIADV